MSITLRDKHGNDIIEERNVSNPQRYIRRYVSDTNVRDVQIREGTNRSQLRIRFEDGSWYREYGEADELREKVSRWRNLHGEEFRDGPVNGELEPAMI